MLLIEDNDVERRRLVDLIGKTGLQVVATSSGDEGLAILTTARGPRERPFDAVVLDLVMPGTSGLDVLRAAAADERLAALPFVVVSAMYMTRTERDVLGRQVIAVVRKGDGTGDELRAGLRRALTARQNGDERLSAPRQLH